MALFFPRHVTQVTKWKRHKAVVNLRMYTSDLMIRLIYSKYAISAWNVDQQTRPFTLLHWHNSTRRNLVAPWFFHVTLIWPLQRNSIMWPSQDKKTIVLRVDNYVRFVKAQSSTFSLTSVIQSSMIYFFRVYSTVIPYVVISLCKKPSYWLE